MPNSSGGNNNQTPAEYPDYDMAEQVQAGDGLYHLADDTGGEGEYTLAEEETPNKGVQNEDDYQLADLSGEDYANFDSIQRYVLCIGLKTPIHLF